MDFKVHGTNIDQQIIESRWLTFPNGHTLSDEALNSFVRHIPTDTSPIHKYSKISAVAMYVMQPAPNPIFSYKVLNFLTEENACSCFDDDLCGYFSRKI